MSHAVGLERKDEECGGMLVRYSAGDDVMTMNDADTLTTTCWQDSLEFTSVTFTGCAS